MPLKSSKSKDITRLIRPQVRKLTAYHVDETPVRIKLDAMENPFPLPEAIRREIAVAAAKCAHQPLPRPVRKGGEEGHCRHCGA